MDYPVTESAKGQCLSGLLPVSIPMQHALVDQEDRVIIFEMADKAKEPSKKHRSRIETDSDNGATAITQTQTKLTATVSVEAPYNSQSLRKITETNK